MFALHKDNIIEEVIHDMSPSVSKLVLDIQNPEDENEETITPIDSWETWHGRKALISPFMDVVFEKTMRKSVYNINCTHIKKEGLDFIEQIIDIPDILANNNNSTTTNILRLQLDQYLRSEEYKGRPKLIQLQELSDQVDSENCFLMPFNWLLSTASKKCLECTEPVPFMSMAVTTKEIDKHRILTWLQEGSIPTYLDYNNCPFSAVIDHLNCTIELLEIQGKTVYIVGGSCTLEFPANDTHILTVENENIDERKLQYFNLLGYMRIVSSSNRKSAFKYPSVAEWYAETSKEIGPDEAWLTHILSLGNVGINESIKTHDDVYNHGMCFFYHYVGIHLDCKSEECRLNPNKYKNTSQVYKNQMMEVCTRVMNKLNKKKLSKFVNMKSTASIENFNRQILLNCPKLLNFPVTHPVRVYATIAKWNESKECDLFVGYREEFYDLYGLS